MRLASYQIDDELLARSADSHDPLAEAIEKIARWVAAVRNQRGDAHHGSQPDQRDAEFVVRMVGLLLLRLGG